MVRLGGDATAIIRRSAGSSALYFDAVNNPSRRTSSVYVWGMSTAGTYGEDIYRRRGMGCNPETILPFSSHHFERVK